MNSRFFDVLLERLIHNDWVRLHALSGPNGPSAMEFIVRSGAKAIVFKVAYDEAHSGESPGNVLSAHTVGWACDCPETTSIDYLTKDTITTRWGAQEYVYEGMMVYPDRLGATLTARWPALLRRRLGSLRRQLKADE